MTFTRLGRITGVAMVGALALTACGSDDTTPGGTTSPTAGGTTAAAADCGTGELKAEGSSAQKNAIEQAISSYSSVCPDVTVNYNPTGSGTGRKQWIAGQVDWAGSDSALKTEAVDGVVEQTAADTACGSPAWNLPMVTGPISVPFNVKGVDKLVLTPEVLANIFSGKVKVWNDPSIAAINSGATLPATPIKVFFRTGESGTTENFTKYLKASAPDAWTKEPSQKWAGIGEGRDGSSGVADSVKNTEGGITYVELSFSKDNQLNYAAVDNGAGPVELTGESAGKAVAAAEVKGEGNNLALKLDYATKAPGAYPIVLVTYEIVCSKNKDAAKGTAIKSFLKHFSSDEVQTSLEEIGYAPLPPEIEAKVATAIDALS